VASVLLVAQAVDGGDHVGAALDDGLLHRERVRHLVRVSGQGQWSGSVVRVRVGIRVRLRVGVRVGVGVGVRVGG